MPCMLYASVQKFCVLGFCNSGADEQRHFLDDSTREKKLKSDCSHVRFELNFKSCDLQSCLCLSMGKILTN